MRLIQNLVVSVLALIVTLIACELVFRLLIFSDLKAVKHLRDAGKYSNQYTDDYWKLYYKFKGGHPPPKVVHPILGWGGYFDYKTYQHRDIKKAGNRKKVQIYGDSFIMCVKGPRCFEDILNLDTTFTQNNFLLNYGVGGYGLDQIYLLCSLTVNLYDDPLIIISILPNDMDRSMLSVRTGQKPYFKLVDDNLQLNGVPVEADPKTFYKNNPPQIKSYLYARYKHSDLNPSFNKYEMTPELKSNTINLNEKIILATDSILKASSVNYIFIIFDNIFNMDGEWRYQHLVNFMHQNKLPYFGTLDLVECDTTFDEYEFTNYMMNENGHPTTHYNMLVSEEIKKYVNDYENYPLQKFTFYNNLKDSTSLEYVMYKIKKTKSWLADVKQKSNERNIPLDSMIYLDAQWVVNKINTKD